MSIFDPTQADGGGTTPPGEIPPGDPGASHDPWTADDLNAATQYYTQYIRDHHLESWGDASDAVRAYQTARRNGMPHDQALSGALHSLGWDHDLPPGPTTPTTPPPPGGTPPPGGGPDPTSTIFDPFPTPTPPHTTAPTPTPAPTFNPPTFSAPPAFHFDAFQGPDQFKAPSLEDAMNDPGYQFERDEGNRALTNAASAKGLLRSGNTLEDFSRWNSNFAQTRYNDVYNRRANEYEQNFNNLFSSWNANRENAINTYTTNYGVSRDVFDRQYDASAAEFAPTLHQWDVNTNLNQRNHELDSDRDFQTWLQQYRIWDDQRRWRYGVLDNERTRGMPTTTTTGSPVYSA